MLKLTSNDYKIIAEMLKEDNSIEIDHKLSKGICYISWSNSNNEGGEYVVIRQNRKTYYIRMSEIENTTCGKDPAPFIAKIKAYIVILQMEAALEYK